MRAYKEAYEHALQKAQDARENGYRYIEVQAREGSPHGYVLVRHLFYRGRDVAEGEGQSVEEWAADVMRRLVKRGLCEGPVETDATD